MAGAATQDFLYNWLPQRSILMNGLHPRRMRRGVVFTLTGALTFLALGALAPLSAHAAVACTPAGR
jgi:hypothetical protein